MKLYSYWRSSTSYRVRAALNLKGVSYETVPVDLVAGEQLSGDYAALNPARGVPVLVLDDGTALTQSMAILDYIEATWPDPALLPAGPVARAQVMAAAHVIATDIHPVNNTRVIRRLSESFGAAEEQQAAWMCHWMAQGFAAVEEMVSGDTAFAFAEAPGLADLCITAQVYNARRRGLDMDPFPNLARIEKNCLAVPAIKAAHPDNQPKAKGAVWAA